ncbi:hypothetical protein [Micromonospora sp. A202]|uniref:hypothetical protein n=1 Tax=Micromonospora sp. A202 TaxID=2572899 RepID=UPI00114F1092|nr:hypothetical protein [Micromonospora sp. A202]
MRLFKVELWPTEPAGVAIAPEQVSDLIWTHADPDDQLEHLRVRVVDDHATVVLFLRTTGGRCVHRTAAGLLERTLTACALRGWEIRQ